MKLSDETLKIFENLSLINQGLVIKKKNSQKSKTTINAIKLDQSVFSEAHIKENFKSDVHIGNLSTFLAVIKSMKNPEFEFLDNFVTVSDGNAKTKLTYSTSIFYVEQEMDKILVNPELEFTVTNDELTKILKSADILSLTHIKITTNKGNIKFEAVNTSNPSSDGSEIYIPSENIIKKSSEDIEATYPRKSFTLLTGDYKVSIFKGKDGSYVTKFKNETNDITYYLVEYDGEDYG